MNNNFKKYKHVKKQIKGKLYTLYIADTDEKRKRGLSGNINLKKNEGMIFIYPYQVTSAFTMKKCNYKLQIIFYDENWNFIDSFIGMPRQNKLISPHKPFKYVVEILL